MGEEGSKSLHFISWSKLMFGTFMVLYNVNCLGLTELSLSNVSTVPLTAHCVVFIYVFFFSPKHT